MLNCPKCKTKIRLDKLSIQSGDILIYPGASEWDLDRLQRAMRQVGLTNVIMYIGEMDDIAVADEKLMNQYGWYRKEGEA